MSTDWTRTVATYGAQARVNVVKVVESLVVVCNGSQRLGGIRTLLRTESGIDHNRQEPEDGSRESTPPAAGTCEHD